MPTNISRCFHARSVRLRPIVQLMRITQWVGHFQSFQTIYRFNVNRFLEFVSAPTAEYRMKRRAPLCKLPQQSVLHRTGQPIVPDHVSGGFLFLTELLDETAYVGTAETSDKIKLRGWFGIEIAEKPKFGDAAIT